MELKDKNVLVFGAGKSGIAAAKLLLAHEARVVLFDGNPNTDTEQMKQEIGDGKAFELCLETLSEEVLHTLDLAVLSPGVPLDLPLVEALKEQKIPVWGEVELAFGCAKGAVLAITGTNGKTTTTALLGEIMKHCFADVKVVGNIGIPYTSIADDTTDQTVTVAEISSFQLETIHTFAPAVSAVLNITPDHLNRHHTMENYIAAKLAITKNQTREQTCVLNYEDDVLRKFAEEAPCSVLFFSSRRKLPQGLYLEDDEIFYADETGIHSVICIDELHILGIHNYENVMAAAGMALSFGVPMETIRSVLRTFQAVEHRIEYVTEKHGVRFYNDSKGTNPDAAIKGIQAMNRPTLLIGGGYDKQSEYGEWIDSFQGKVKKLVLIGQTKEKIAETAREHGFYDVVFADSLKEAIEICYRHAEAGDAVLLSPACASWGMFPNYEVRGNLFKEIVCALKE